MKLDSPRLPRPPVELASQARFRRPALRVALGVDENPLAALKSLIGRHFAGAADRPTPAELAGLLRAPRPDRRGRILLYNLFASMRFPEYRELAHCAGISLHDLARAIRHSGAKPARAIRWLNQFAAPPPAPRPSRGRE